MNNVARKDRVLGHLLLLLVVALAAVLITLRFVSSGEGAGASGTGDGTSGADDAGSSSAFAISGKTATPMSPGVMAALDLIFTNPHDVPMSVTDLSVTVRKVTAPNADDAHPCVVGDFSVGKASGSIKITVAAGATSALSSLGLPRATWPQVGMLERPANQDGCKGASLTLAYAASGTLSQ
jgi:hypothetical protein